MKIKNSNNKTLININNNLKLKRNKIYLYLNKYYKVQMLYF